MRKLLLSMMAAMCVMFMACGAKPAKAGSESPARDALMSDEAVASRVADVYNHIRSMRQYYMETPPEEIVEGKWQPVDNLFATREWKNVREAVDSVGRANENGGFFGFGEEGPLDPWQYDCFEGQITVSDVKAKLTGDNTATVDFKIKDVTSYDSVPLRWLMCLEDGEWRVANIIFVKDNNLDLLQSMKQYLSEN